MKVCIQTMMGKLYIFEISSEGLTGKQMKKELETVEGGYWENYTLVFGGSIIEDSKNILEYGVQEGSKIQSLTRYIRCTCDPCRIGPKVHF